MNMRESLPLQRYLAFLIDDQIRVSMIILDQIYCDMMLFWIRCECVAWIRLCLFPGQQLFPQWVEIKIKSHYILITEVIDQG